MDTIQLKKIKLSTEMMDSEYINSNFVHISGDSNIGTLQLSGNMLVGNDNSSDANVKNAIIVGADNNIKVSNSIIVGKSNIIGAYGYKVVSYVKIKDGAGKLLNTRLSVDSEIDPIVNEKKPLYSIDASGAYTNVGNVISVDFETNEIIIDNKLFINDTTHYPVLNNIIYFTEYPNIGNSLIVAGEHSFVTGNKNLAIGACAHAEGGYNVASNNYAHVEGKKTIAAWGSHAEGAANMALGNCSHSQGRVNITKGSMANTAGIGNIANGWVSHAVGCMSQAKDKYAFVWNGKQLYGYQGDNTKKYDYDYPSNWQLSDTTLTSEDDRSLEYIQSEQYQNDTYKSNGIGTFNVNPEGGLNGFFIGQTSLNDIIDHKVELRPQIKEFLDTCRNEYTIGDYLYETSTTYVNSRLNSKGELVDKYGPTTDFIKVCPYEKVCLYGRGLYGNKAYAFYDSNKNTLSTFPASGDATISYEIVEIPSNVEYVRVSFTEGDGSAKNRNKMPHLFRLNASKAIDSISADIIKKSQTSFDKTQYTDLAGKYVVSNSKAQKVGNDQVMDLANCYITDLLDINILDGLSVCARSVDSTSIMQYFNKFGIFISDEPTGYNKDGTSYPVKIWTNQTFDLATIKQTYPTATYIRFCSYYNKLKLLKNEVMTNAEGFEYLETKDLMLKNSMSHVFNNVNTVNMADYSNPEIELSAGFQNKGTYSPYPNAGRTTEKLTLVEADGLSVTARSAESTMIYNYFKKDGTYLTCDGFAMNESSKYISYVVTDEVLSRDEILKKYPLAYYIRICSYGKILEIKRKQNNDEVLHSLSSEFIGMIGKVDPTIYANLISSDIFFGKKYVAMGDSFTEIVVGYDEGVESEGYDSTWKMWKTYPYWIAKKHQMTLTNGAKNGQSMRYQEAKKTNCGAILYQNISSELSTADYITLSFGQNEGLTEDTVGTKDSSDINTEWGAWNTVLSSIYTWNPDVHIGIIGYESTSGLTINTHKAIAEWWGIPYYDLRSDKNTPLIMESSGKIGIELNPFAVSTRRKAFQSYNKDGSVNLHPNLNGHKYKSAIIENFMRSI